MAVSFVGDRVVTARCMVPGKVVPYEELRPAHLVKHRTPHLLVMYGLNPLEIDHPRNGILMLDSIEKALNHLGVCFLDNAMYQEFTEGHKPQHPDKANLTYFHRGAENIRRYRWQRPTVPYGMFSVQTCVVRGRQVRVLTGCQQWLDRQHGDSRNILHCEPVWMSRSASVT